MTGEATDRGRRHARRSPLPLSNAELSAYNFGARMASLFEDLQPFFLARTFPDGYASAEERQAWDRLGGLVWWHFATRGINETILAAEERRR